MTSPIEKLRARSDAYAMLGLHEDAGPGEIHAAWRRVAFEVHPDRNGGDPAAFERAKAAYDLIAPSAARAGGGASAGARAGARPRVTTRYAPLSPEAIEACRALLREAEGGRPADPCAMTATDHVPEAIRRHGRSLTYLVPTVLTAGVNRVALPTAVLEDPRRVNPRVLTVRAARSGAGEVRVPDRQRERLFPGARSVQIRFAEA
jgi:hypothetical protein